MALEIKVPSLGQSVPEAVVSQWLKAEGAAVAADEAVVELETDKITMEVTAFKAGTLASILKQSGETVGVGEVLGLIATEGEDVDAVGSAGRPAEAPADAEPMQPVEAEVGEVVETPVAAPTHHEPVIPDDMKTSPAVRRLAREEGVDLTTITGTGRGGRVTKRDVVAYLQGPPQAAVTPAPAAATATGRTMPAGDEPVERVPMTPIRKTIALRMAESKRTAAHVTTVDEVDMGSLVELRDRIKSDFLEQHGVKLTYMPFIMKASIAALKEFPEVNASIDGGEIVYHGYYHIGVAVHTEAGLVVPVVKHADRKSIVTIAAEITDLATRARKRKLEMDDIQGATFTLSNAGGFGAILSTPVISQPESAVLGIHKIVERPVARGGKVVIRPIMWFGLSYDHRLVDGTPAVMFLRRVSELLEDPERLLLEA